MIILHWSVVIKIRDADVEMDGWHICKNKDK